MSDEELQRLRARLDETEAALRAIRAGELDALVGDSEAGRVYSHATAERSYRLMVERMAEGAVTLAESSGRILYCNQAFATMIGRPLEHVIGRPIHTFVAPTGNAPLDALWSSVEPHRADYELLAAGSKRVPVTVSSVLVEGTPGNTRCLVVADLTARIDVKRLRDVQRELELESRRKDDFIATLGHELRNPLAPILHAAELLGGDEIDRAELARLRSTIVRQVEHMRRLVDDLLDMARVARGRLNIELRPLDAREIVATAVEATADKFRPLQRRLEVRLPAGPFWVDADRVRLTQVLTNLLTNAAKFTDEGGRTVLSLDASMTEVTFTVQDDGRGIEPEMLGAIFEAFVQEESTFDRAAGGLGMGLALVKRIVDLHHGRVIAHSTGKGHGARFVVHLPRLHRPEDTVVRRRRPGGPGRGDTMRLPVAAVHAAAERSEPSTTRVLVCDDNVDAADMMSLVLRSRGFEVRTAHSGGEALQVVSEFLPHCVLLDIGLPDLDGYEVARRLRASTEGRSIVVAAITGYGQKTDREAALAAGCDFHLVKPVAPERLDEVLAFIGRHGVRT